MVGAAVWGAAHEDRHGEDEDSVRGLAQDQLVVYVDLQVAREGVYCVLAVVVEVDGAGLVDQALWGGGFTGVDQGVAVFH